MRHRGQALAWRCVVVACALAAMSSAGAAALPGTVLPDGRGYQLVSPAQKNSGHIGPAAISPDGRRVEFSIAQGPSTGTTAVFLSQPAGSGWAPKTMIPPADQLLFSGSYTIVGWTPSLSAFYAIAHPGLLGNIPITVLRLDGEGGQSQLAALPPGSGVFSAGVVGSADGSHVYVDDETPLDPGHVAGTLNVYDFGSDPPVLASRLPDDTVPACGVEGAGGQAGFADSQIQSSLVQHWVSADGSRVFFLTPGNVCDGSAPTELYVRDRNANGGAGATTLISGPALSGPDSDATFIGASTDGSQVVYVTAAELTADDTNSNPDAYRYTSGPGGGNECLTCLVADANVAYNPGNGDGVAVSEDLSHVYFISDSQLVAGKGAAGVPNLYVWHKDPGGSVDRIDWVASAEQIATALINNGATGAALTPDGNVLSFTSSFPGLDTLTPGQTNGGFREVYRYDDRPQDASAGLTCVSCPANGATPTVDANSTQVNYNALVPETRMMSDDGNTIFFRTSEPLVPQDVNGTNDIYEWRDGQVQLISDGVTPQVKFSDADQLMGTTSSGDDVFFSSFSHLTGDQLDNSNQLYDAKIGAQAPPAPKLPCVGEACQGPLPGLPALPDAGSADYSGSGNTRVPVARIGIAHITSAQQRAFARTGRLTLAIGLTVPGRLSIAARGKLGHHTHTLATARRTTHRPGVVKIGLRLTHAARLQLAAHRRLHVTMTVRYSELRAPQHIALTLTTAARTGRT